MTAVQNNLKYYGSFTNPIHIYWLDSGEGLRAFHGRRSFASLFPEPDRKEIRRYLRARDIRFRNADPGELTALVEFISGRRQNMKGK